jgi:predicted GH43/DUF377 family glycosyl hydrolase
MSIIKRFPQNPILLPTENAWEKKAVFNPGAIEIDGVIHLVYRAMSLDNNSVLGYARSEDGLTISYRSKDPIYIPRESFELRAAPEFNSGCEDPRLTQIGSTIYMCYTAYNSREPWSVAVSSISVEDFKNNVWNWSPATLIKPSYNADKDACIMPFEKDGHYLFIHRLDSIIYGNYINLQTLESVADEMPLINPRPGMWDSQKVGLSAPPIKIAEGWLMLYHGVSDNSMYRVGACLLDGNDPTQVLARSHDWLLEPETDYEKMGQVNSVVFPCGAILRDDTLFIYYGGGDSVTGVATVSVQDILHHLRG